MIHKFILMMKQDATNVPIPNEFDDDADFWSHEICKNYESNRNGIVRNIKLKKVVGFKNNEGYLMFTCSGNCCRGDKKNKKHLVHRFIWESFNGIIEKDKIIDHIDNDPSNNNLENLQMINQHENLKKDYKHPDNKPISIKAINIKSGEVFIYRSITGASKDLNINRGSIYKTLIGLHKTALSKKYGERYTFKKIDKNSEITSTVIIIKNKINLPIHHVKKMIVNNNS